MIQFRFDVLRSGVPIAQLLADQNTPPEITFQPNAEIKMTLSGTFIVPAHVDLIVDVIRPVMILEGIEHAMGRFLAADPKENWVENQVTTEISAFDLTYFTVLSVLEHYVSFSAGTKYTNVLRQLLVESGITRFYIQPSDAVLQTDREDWPPGTTRMSVLNDLLTEMNYQTLWMDKDGLVRCEAYQPPTAQRIDHIYNHGAHGVILPQMQRTQNTFALPNVFRAYVENPDYAVPLVAVAENNNPASPVSTVSRGLRVPLIKKLDNIASEQHLQSYVENLRIKHEIATQTISFSSPLEPLHGCADVMALYRGNASGIYQEYGWRLEASSAGTYEHTGRKVLYL